MCFLLAPGSVWVLLRGPGDPYWKPSLCLKSSPSHPPPLKMPSPLPSPAHGNKRKRGLGICFSWVESPPPISLVLPSLTTDRFPFKRLMGDGWVYNLRQVSSADASLQGLERCRMPPHSTPPHPPAPHPPHPPHPAMEMVGVPGGGAKPRPDLFISAGHSSAREHLLGRDKCHTVGPKWTHFHVGVVVALLG